MAKNRTTGIVLSYLNTFLNMISGLFLSSFLLRQLGDANYGVYQTMSSFANYLVLLEFGTGTVISRNLSACRARNASRLEIHQNISTIWSVTAALSSVILLVSVVFYLVIPGVYAKSMTPAQILDGQKMFLFIVVFLLASFFGQTLNGITLGYEHYTYTSIVSIIRILSRTTLLIVLIVGLKQALVIAMVDAIISSVITVFTYIYCRRSFQIEINFRNFDRMVLKASLPLCLAMFLQVVVSQSNNLVGKFILGVMLGPEEVSLYSVGLYVYSIFSSLTTIPVSMYVPQVTRDVLSGLEGKDLTKTLVQPCRLIVLVSGSVLFGFIACGKPFISIVYGQKYLLSWIMSILLMAPMFLNMANAVVLNVLDAKNKRLIRSYILMFTTALNVLMTIFGIRRFGIVAAAAATGVATLLQTVVMNIYYEKKMNLAIPYLFIHIFKGILPYQILGALVGYVVGTFFGNDYLSFLLSGVAYILVAMGGFVLLGKNATEKNMLAKYLPFVKE